jgi:hypothetical protein
MLTEALVNKTVQAVVDLDSAILALHYAEAINKTNKTTENINN